MARLESVSAQNWPLLKKGMFHTELMFHPKIRSSQEEMLEALSEKDSIGIALVESGIFMGDMIAYHMTEKEILDFCGEPLPGEKVAYIMKFAIEKKYQGMGHGKKLMSDFIGTARENGYTMVMGHFRQNSSYHIAKKFGAVDVKVCRGWEGTKEDYILCRIPLR